MIPKFKMFRVKINDFTSLQCCAILLSKMVKGMGGAMDLVTSSNNIIVAMTHTNRQGQSKLLKRCTLPITGVSCVKKIVTDLAVIEVTSKGFKLTEVAPSVSEDEIINSTDADLIIDKNLKTMVL